MKRKVAVIGAGLSGIAAVKELKEEGHDVTCFEKNQSFGGVFSNDGFAYDSLNLTVTNYFMAFSDFVPTEERMKFWTARNYTDYLRKYMDKNGLFPHINFGTEVSALEKDGTSWLVSTKTHDGVEKQEIFDSVAICSGMFQEPKIPDIEGLDTFQGEVYHSKDYVNKEPYEGKRVLCLGLGESSSDITAEISTVTDKCFLSLRRYPAVAPRVIPFQKDPFFTIDTSVFTSRIIHYFPYKVHKQIVERILRKSLGSKNPAMVKRIEWTRKSGSPVHQVITKNERLFTHIVDNEVDTNFSGIERLTKDSVIFKDGREEKIDTIMFCTGFKTTFPFLDLKIDNIRNLYKQMFHHDYDKSLAFIGFARPHQGGIPSLSEMQSRYFAQLCSDKMELPNLADRIQQTQKDRLYWENEYHITPHISSLVNYNTYIDSLAELVGCKPKIPSFFKDRNWYLKMWFGTQFSAQYRLEGPHAKPEEARKFLESFPIPYAKKRMYALLIKKAMYEFIWRILGTPSHTQQT